MAVKVSIIMPVYRCAAYITDTLQSVAAQTEQDFELLLVDDHGGDDSMDVAERALQTLGLAARTQRFATPHNAGPGAARNVGLQAATGAYIAFLDSDDRWLPTFLAEMLPTADRQPDLVYCGIRFEGGPRNGTCFFNPTVKNYVFSAREKQYFLRHYVTYSVCFLFRRNFLEKSGIKFPVCRNSEDTCFLTCCLLAARSIVCIPQALYVYCIHTHSLTTTPTPTRYKERLTAMRTLIRSYRSMKNDPQFADLHLGHYRGVLCLILLKKGVAQALLDCLKTCYLLCGTKIRN